MAAEADEMDIEEDTCDRDEGVKESRDETWDDEKKCIPQHVTIVKQVLTTLSIHSDFHHSSYLFHLVSNLAPPTFNNFQHLWIIDK